MSGIFTPLDPTEPSDDFERKRHYQTLKARCLEVAALLRAPLGEPNSENLVEEMAKRFYRSITEERWGSEPMEEPSDATDRA